MGAQQVELQGFQIRLGNTLVGELAKTGVDTINRITALGRFLHQRRTRAYAGQGGFVNFYGLLAVVNVAQLRKAKLSRMYFHALKCFRKGC